MPDDSTDLYAVLASLRERGALGESSLARAIAHSAAFVAALPLTTSRLLDLGSGGGLPGLVIAVQRRDLEVVLTDRRERRADLLRLACSQLGLDQRVEVVTADVVELGRGPAFAHRFDAVTARAFGEAMWTARCAAPFLTPRGVVLVSEPPVDPAASGPARWNDAELTLLGLRRSVETFAHVQRLEQVARAG